MRVTGTRRSEPGSVTPRVKAQSHGACLNGQNVRPRPGVREGKRVEMAAMHEHTQRANLAISCANDSPPVAQRARALADALALPIARDNAVGDVDLLLTVTDERLELRSAAAPHRRGFAADFSAFADKRDRAHLSKRQPIARAFGKNVTTILDATAGWGRDAFLLATLGYQVTAIERSPIVAALLREGIERADLRDARFTIVQGDARHILPTLAPTPDAVYLDPMYPPKKKQSARSRQSIELLRALVGSDEDARELFDVAMASAARRVVVKRADDAPQLAPNPTTSHAGKTVRYDVYVTTGSAHP
jgi:16S rRNA (guanine1516-N2)-methyltransferase